MAGPNSLSLFPRLLKRNRQLIARGKASVAHASSNSNNNQRAKKLTEEGPASSQKVLDCLQNSMTRKMRPQTDTAVALALQVLTTMRISQISEARTGFRMMPLITGATGKHRTTAPCLAIRTTGTLQPTLLNTKEGQTALPISMTM